MKNIEIQIDETPRKTGFNTWTLATAATENETYEIQMVRFDEPSEFGIREGRISKLYIADASGKTALNYDRGWDLRPQTTATKALPKAILAKFN